MSRLQYPLKNQLQDPADEATLHRIAQALRSRSHKAQPHRRFVAPALAAAFAVVATLFVFWRIEHDGGPLTLADGQEFSAVTAEATTEIALSDGSRIRLAPGARLAPLVNSAKTFSAIVTRGRAEFVVQPNGPRTWIIECGLATVEVVGTAFACERSPGRLRVSVDHGIVLVRGEYVPERAQRLVGGEELEVVDRGRNRLIDRPPLPPTPPTARSIRADAGAKAEAPKGTSSATTPRKTREWRELARRGRNVQAFEILGAEGLRNESRKLGVSDLLALADVARLSGHPADAVIPLERVLTEFSGDPQAPLAAFALGRLYLDSLGRPQAAISALEKALALGVPSGLREDVRARLVEAYARSGDSRGTELAAEAYLKEFPNGRYTRAVSRWRHK